MNLFYQKYLKYKTKYLKLKQQIGGNYNCDNTKRIKNDLCIDKADGEYEDKNACEYKCALSKLDIEIEIWKVYIHKLLELDYTIYAKGGSILGIIVLKDLITYGTFSEELVNSYNLMNLIKDWDLTIVNITTEQQSEIITLGGDDIKNEAISFPVLRYKDGILINDENLLELSLKTSENLSDLEIPLTAIKLRITKDNIDTFFNLVKILFNKEHIYENICEIKKIFNILDLTPSNIKYQNGLFDLSKMDLSDGGLSPLLLNIIDESIDSAIDPYVKLSYKQFIISQFKEPDRLIFRFFDKNLKKSNNIKKIYEKYSIPIPEFLINEELTINILMNFCKKINEYIVSEFSKTIPVCFRNIIEPLGAESTAQQRKKYAKDVQEFKKNCIDCMINFSSEMNKLFININLARFSRYISLSLKDNEYPIKKIILLSLCPIEQLELLNKSLGAKYVENTFKFKNSGSNTKYLNYLLEIIKNTKIAE